MRWGTKALLAVALVILLPAATFERQAYGQTYFAPKISDYYSNPSKRSPGDFYQVRVRKNQGWHHIASRHQISPRLLRELNPQINKVLSVGDIVNVPRDEVNVLVSKSKNELRLRLGKRELIRYCVSTGLDGCTPNGSFKIINIIEKPTWYWKGKVIAYGSKEHKIGTRWMGLNVKGYGIHGTTEPHLLGKAVSDGCIRLKNKDVESLALMVTINTPVRIIN